MKSASVGATAERLPIIDLVRLVSILVVLAIHLSVARIAAQPDSQGWHYAWLLLSNNGSYGVTMFFVVSGFVITRTIVRRNPNLAELDLRGFYVRRVARILPLFLLTVTIGAVALWVLDPESRPVQVCFHEPKADFGAFFWLALPTFSFNWLRIAHGPEYGLHWDILWSLAIEEQFYLCYPLLLRRLGTQRNAVTFLLGVVAVGPLVRMWAVWHDPENFLLAFTNSFAAFEQLAMGCLLCFTLGRLERKPLPARWQQHERIIGLLGLVGLVLTYWKAELSNPQDRIWGPSSIAFCLCLFLGAGIRRGWFESRIASALTYPGQLSYGGYLFHPFMLFLLWPWFVDMPVFLAFGIFAVATLSLAGLSFRYFEVPANLAIRDWVWPRVPAKPQPSAVVAAPELIGLQAAPEIPRRRRTDR